MKKKPFEVKYYGNTDDPMWQLEVECLFPWLFGKGVDVGCGARTIGPDVVRVDIDEAVEPDFCCSGDDLPFKDGEYDFLMSIHSFEHFPDARKLLSEWLRVVRKAGIVAIVHPNIAYTKKQNPENDNPGLKANPFNRHYHEHTPESFVAMLGELSDLPFRLLDYGPACNRWSFFAILKKT